MIMETPVYADGIVKSRQTRFNGLNHNPGAGDGEIYEMTNLCSDYYPLLATRARRRKLRTIPQPNGIFAAGELCWVSGTGFYYGGTLKGIVADSRKTFMQINGVIIILPDKKYYDTVEDEFGNLESEYRADGKYYEVNRYQGLAREDPVRTMDYLTEVGEIDTPWEAAADATYLVGDYIHTMGGTTYRGFEFLSGAILRVGGSNTQYFSAGDTVRFTGDTTKTGNRQLFTVSSVNETEGTVTFLDGEFTTGWAAVFITVPMKICTAEFLKDEEDTTGASLLHFKGKQMSAEDWSEAGCAAGFVITISDCSISANNGSYTLQDVVTIGDEAYLKFTANCFRAGTSAASGVFLTTLTISQPTGVRWTVVNQTLQIESAWLWAELGENYHFEQGKYVEVSGSGHEEYNGYWEITHVAAYTLTVAFPNSSGYQTVQEVNGDIAFQLYEPKTLYFTQRTVDGVTRDTVKIIGRSDWAVEDGDAVWIHGCSIAENNGIFDTKGFDALNYDMLFEAGTFTQGTDSGYATVITTRTPGDIRFTDGTLYGEAASANTIKANDVDWSAYFSVGDAVKISGCEEEANNLTIIIREIDGDEMHFYENSFTLHNDTNRTVVISRVMPWEGELEGMFECDNRAWTWKDNTVYASKLGDPFNWQVFDGLETDSWAVDVSGTAAFTGGINYQGYPTFMRDQDLYKVYGSLPSNFELIRVATTGCAPGSEQSLAVAGETLFYLNRNGVAAYAGGTPSMIARAFGTERYRNAVAGSDGVKYYVSMEDSDGVWHLFVYDTQKGQWHEEDNTEVIGFAYYDGNLYYLDAEGNIMLTGNMEFYPEGTEQEAAFDWAVEFTDFTDDSPNKKGIKSFQIRMELEDLSGEEDSASVTVKVMCDSDGEWIIPKGGTIENPEKRSYVLPIIPRRADHYRIRIEGHGGCRIYSIAKDYYPGSELKSLVGRQ